MDSLGTPVPCSKEGGDFICSNVTYGKIPVLATGGGDCQWKLCDVDTLTNKVDLNSCKPTSYSYYTEPKVDGKGGCNLKNFNNTDHQTIDSSCCCDADSLCDYTNCCGGVPEAQCGFKDFADNFFNASYLHEPTQQYVCLAHGKNNVCAQLPADYVAHPDRYPQIKIPPGGAYHSSLCDCVKSESACETNPLNCQPKVGCVACNPDQKPGDWVCNNGKCTTAAAGKGAYQTQDDCRDNCGTIDRFSCVEGKCTKDPEGVFFSSGSCQNGCSKLSSAPSDYDARKTIIKVLAYLSLGVLILILLLVLFYVFNFIRRKQRERR